MACVPLLSVANKNSINYSEILDYYEEALVKGFIKPSSEFAYNDFSGQRIFERFELPGYYDGDSYNFTASSFVRYLERTKEVIPSLCKHGYI